MNRQGKSTQLLETLEDRRLLSVSTTADGWTNITPSSDSRMIYVSTSGSDSNPGTQAKPIKTLAKAKTLVRDKMPDWVLLKRGETFNDAFPDWVVSGRSAQEPTVITAYGAGARPRVLTGVNGGITIAQKYSNPVNHVAVIGLHFNANTYNGSNGTFKTAGIRVMRKGSNILLEDNFIQGYKDNIVIDPDGSLVGVKIRRNVIVDAFNAQKVGNGHAQGVYGGPNADGTLIEENVFDHNGWKEGVAKAGPTMFNHSIYFNTGSSGLVVRNNIITRSSLRGVLSRGGAVVENNLFSRNPVAVQVGNGSSTVQNNVILEGNDLTGQQQLGKGVEAFSMSQLLVRNNVIAHEASAGTYNNIGVNVQSGVGGGQIKDNVIFKWNYGIKGAGGGFSITGNKITNSPTGFSDPNRLLDRYNASLGRTGSFEAFIASARGLSRDAYDTRYTARAAGGYVRAGFGLSTAARTALAAATPVSTGTSKTSVWSEQQIDSTSAAV